MTVLLGTLWSSIKQIEAPYVFDWENAIALDTMQGMCLNDHMDTLGKVLGEKNSFYGVKLNILSFLQLPHAQTSLFIEQ